jgi:hypothetical protein
MKLSARDYLTTILPGLADISIQRVAELTPSAWAAQHSELAREKRIP